MFFAVNPSVPANKTKHILKHANKSSAANSLILNLVGILFIKLFSKLKGI